MKVAAILQFGSKYANIAIQLVITAVLARLISPGEFGLLSIVTVFSSFFQLFSDMGIGVAIVQYRGLTDEDLGGLFTFSALLAAGLTILFCIASMPISWFYGDGRLVGLCCAASPALLFATLNMVPNGVMLRERRFGAIAVRLVVSTVFSGVLAIGLALAGVGCYALVAQTVASSFAVFVWNVAANPPKRVNVHFVAPLRRIFSYSAYQFGFSFINYFSRNLDNLVIGRAFGSLALGYYDKAYKLTTYPLSSLSSVIASVVQPYMAENQDKKRVMFDCFMKVEKLLSLAGALIVAVFLSCSHEIVTLFYGEAWTPSVPLFQVLAVSVYFQLLSNPTGAFFQSLGRTDLMFRCGVATALLTLLGLLLGAAAGSVGAIAIGISAAYCLQAVPLAYFLFVRGFEEPVGSLFAFLPEMAVGGLAISVALLCDIVLPAAPFLRLGVKLAVVCVAVGLGYLVTGQVAHLRSLVSRK